MVPVQLFVRPPEYGKRIDVLTQEAEITFLDQDTISIVWTDAGSKTTEQLKRKSGL